VVLNTYAVVSPSLESVAARVSQDLARDTRLQPFPARGFRVHCTLYLTEYTASSVPAVTAAVRALAGRTRRLPVTSTGLHRTRGQWLFVNIDDGPALRGLAAGVVEALEPLRARDPRVPDWLAAYPEKRAVFDRYGSPNVGDAYEPHLTVLAQANGPALDAWFASSTVAREELTRRVAGEVVAVGVGEADELGQVRTPLLEVALR
jgi:hypothetical protein